jgi:hypothetical protein
LSGDLFVSSQTCLGGHDRLTHQIGVVIAVRC